MPYAIFSAIEIEFVTYMMSLDGASHINGISDPGGQHYFGNFTGARPDIYIPDLKQVWFFNGCMVRRK